MSSTSGLSSNQGKNKAKYTGININTIYKGSNTQSQKSTGTRHGMHTLGKVIPQNPRRMPPPAQVPSIKSESFGNDPNITLVPSGKTGWGEKTSNISSNPKISESQKISSPISSGQQLMSSNTNIDSAQSVPSSSNSQATKSWVPINVKQTQQYDQKSTQFSQEFPTLEDQDVEKCDEKSNQTTLLKPQTITHAWAAGTNGGNRPISDDRPSGLNINSTALDRRWDDEDSRNLYHRNMVQNFKQPPYPSSQSNKMFQSTSYQQHIAKQHHQYQTQIHPSHYQTSPYKDSGHSIIKDAKIEELSKKADNIADGNWASERGSVDYNEKLVFSDEEESDRKDIVKGSHSNPQIHYKGDNTSMGGQREWLNKHPSYNRMLPHQANARWQNNPYNTSFAAQSRMPLTQSIESPDFETEDDRFYDQKRQDMIHKFHENFSRGQERLKNKLTDDVCDKQQLIKTVTKNNEPKTVLSHNRDSSDFNKLDNKVVNENSKSNWVNEKRQTSSESISKNTPSKNDLNSRNDIENKTPKPAHEPLLDEKRILQRKKKRDDNLKNKSTSGKKIEHAAPIPIPQSTNEQIDQYRGNYTSLVSRSSSRKNNDKSSSEKKLTSKRESIDKSSPTKDSVVVKSEPIVETSSQSAVQIVTGEIKKSENLVKKKDDNANTKRIDKRHATKRPRDDQNQFEKGGRRRNRGTNAENLYDSRSGFSNRGREFVRGGQGRSGFSGNNRRYDNYEYYDQYYDESTQQTSGYRRNRRKGNSSEAVKGSSSKAEKKKDELKGKGDGNFLENSNKISQKKTDKVVATNNLKDNGDIVPVGEPSRRGRGGRHNGGDRSRGTSSKQSYKSEEHGQFYRNTYSMGNNRDTRGWNSRGNKRSNDRGKRPEKEKVTSRNDHSDKNVTVSKQGSNDIDEWETASETSVAVTDKESINKIKKDETIGKKSFTSQRPPNGGAGNGNRGGNRGPLKASNGRRDNRQKKSGDIQTHKNNKEKHNEKKEKPSQSEDKQKLVSSVKTVDLNNIDLNNISKVTLVDKLPYCDSKLDNDSDEEGFEIFTNKKQAKSKGPIQLDTQPPPIKKERKDSNKKNLSISARNKDIKKSKGKSSKLNDAAITNIENNLLKDNEEKSTKLLNVVTSSGLVKIETWNNEMALEIITTGQQQSQTVLAPVPSENAWKKPFKFDDGKLIQSVNLSTSKVAQNLSNKTQSLSKKPKSLKSRPPRLTKTRKGESERKDNEFRNVQLPINFEDPNSKEITFGSNIVETDLVDDVKLKLNLKNSSENIVMSSIIPITNITSPQLLSNFQQEKILTRTSESSEMLGSKFSNISWSSFEPSGSPSASIPLNCTEPIATSITSINKASIYENETQIASLKTLQTEPTNVCKVRPVPISSHHLSSSPPVSIHIQQQPSISIPYLNMPNQSNYTNNYQHVMQQHSSDYLQNTFRQPQQQHMVSSSLPNFNQSHTFSAGQFAKSLQYGPLVTNSVGSNAQSAPSFLMPYDNGQQINHNNQQIGSHSNIGSNFMRPMAAPGAPLQSQQQHSSNTYYTPNNAFFQQHNSNSIQGSLQQLTNQQYNFGGNGFSHQPSQVPNYNQLQKQQQINQITIKSPPTAQIFNSVTPSVSSSNSFPFNKPPPIGHATNIPPPNYRNVRPQRVPGVPITIANTNIRHGNLVSPSILPMNVSNAAITQQRLPFSFSAQSQQLIRHQYHQKPNNNNNRPVQTQSVCSTTNQQAIVSNVIKEQQAKQRKEVLQHASNFLNCTTSTIETANINDSNVTQNDDINENISTSVSIKQLGEFNGKLCSTRNVVDDMEPSTTIDNVSNPVIDQELSPDRAITST